MKKPVTEGVTGFFILYLKDSCLTDIWSLKFNMAK